MILFFVIVLRFSSLIAAMPLLAARDAAAMPRCCHIVTAPAMPPLRDAQKECACERRRPPLFHAATSAPETPMPHTMRNILFTLTPFRYSDAASATPRHHPPLSPRRLKSQLRTHPTRHAAQQACSRQRHAEEHQLRRRARYLPPRIKGTTGRERRCLSVAAHGHSSHGASSIRPKDTPPFPRPHAPCRGQHMNAPA